MKFRAISRDYEQIQYLLKVMQSICKFSTFLIFKLSANKIELMADSKHKLGPFVVKCDMNAEDYFQEYSFRGVSNENNLIYFDIRCESLSQVLSSFLTNIKSIKLKLSNKDGKSVLSIEVDYPTTDSNRSIRHDIGIGIIQRKFWQSIGEADFGPFDLSLYLPEFKIVGTAIDRLTNISHYVMIGSKVVGNKGVFSIGVETDSIAVKSKFSQLDLNLNNQINCDESQSSSIKRPAVKVRIDVRKLNLIFSSLNTIKPSSIICHLKNEERIHLQFFHNFVNFQAIIPNVAL